MTGHSYKLLVICDVFWGKYSPSFMGFVHGHVTSNDQCVMKAIVRVYRRYAVLRSRFCKLRTGCETTPMSSTTFFVLRESLFSFLSFIV